MADHPDTEKLRSFVDRLSNGDGRDLLAHLLRCPDCARWVLDLLEDSAESPDLGNVVPFGIASTLEKVWAESFSEAEAERRESQGRLDHLLTLTPEERRSRMRSDARYRTWALADRALDAMSPLLTLDPRRAREQILLGLEVAGALDPTVYGERLLADLEARGRSLLGEAHRRLGDLAAADRAFLLADSILEQSVDPVETARFEHLLGLLRRDQGRFPEARARFDQAVSIYLEVGDRERSARPLTSLGIAQMLDGGLDDAAVSLHEAVDRLENETKTLPRLLARYHLVVVLVELERYPEAQRVCARTAPLFADWPKLNDDPRVIWLRALLAAGTGNPERAVEMMEDACGELREHSGERSFAAALMDLETLHRRARLGARFERAKALCLGDPV